MKLSKPSLVKFILFTAMFAPFVVQAAGFDCTKAKKNVEKLICADAYLSKLDSDLNQVFNEAQAETAGINGDTGEQSDPLGTEEKLWLSNIRNKCKDTACLIRAYEHRIKNIKLDWLEK